MLAKLDGVLDKLSGADLRRAGPALEQLQGQIARDFADKLTTLPEEPDPAGGRAGRRAPGAPASLCRIERALSAAHPARPSTSGSGRAPSAS